MEQDIPITTHCQTGSFAVGSEKKRLKQHTTPKNSRRLMRRPEFGGLRINFAHMGGESGTDDMFEPFRIDKDSWTWIIIELLKKHPNTYADLSAYDYSTDEHRRDLMKVFEKDARGEWNRLGPHALADKVTRGSDVPLVISDKSYRENQRAGNTSRYRHYIGSFINTVNASKKLEAVQKQSLIVNLTETNPARFLGL